MSRIEMGKMARDKAPDLTLLYQLTVKGEGIINTKKVNGQSEYP